MKHGYVYLLRADNGLYKIGRARNVARRMKSFLKLPYELQLIHIIATDDMYEIEADMHFFYADKKMLGEWFALSDEDVRNIKANDVVVTKDEEYDDQLGLIGLQYKDEFGAYKSWCEKVASEAWEYVHKKDDEVRSFCEEKAKEKR